MIDAFVKHLMEEFLIKGQYGELVIKLEDGKPVHWTFKKSYLASEVLTGNGKKCLDKIS